MLELGDLALRIKQLKQRQEILHINRHDIENMLANKKVELIDLKMMTEYSGDLSQIISESSIEERKALIRGFIKDIKVR